MNNSMGKFGVLTHIMDGISPEKQQASSSLYRIMMDAKSGDILDKQSPRTIGELRSSVSYDAMNTLMSVESDDIIERRKLVVEYLELMMKTLDIKSFATQFDIYMRDENTSNQDLKQYIEETRPYREHGFLKAFDAQIGEEAVGDPLTEALARHGIINPLGFLLSDEGKEAGITTKYDQFLRDSRN